MVRPVGYCVLLAVALAGCATTSAPVSRPVAPRPSSRVNLEPLPVAEPQTAGDYLTLGDFFLARDGQDARALASYQKALALQPDAKAASQAYCGMGEVYRRTRDYGKAVVSFNAAVKADESNPRAWTYLGVCYYDQAIGEGRLNAEYLHKAIELLSKAIAVEPAYAEAYMWRGRARQFLGFKIEAVQDYDAAVDLGLPPGATDLVREQLANSLFDTGQYDRAIEEWGRLLARASGSPRERRRWQKLIQVAQRAKAKEGSP